MSLQVLDNALGSRSQYSYIQQNACNSLRNLDQKSSYHHSRNSSLNDLQSVSKSKGPSPLKPSSRRTQSIFGDVGKQSKDDFYLKNLIHSPHLDRELFRVFLNQCWDNISYVENKLQSPPQEYIDKKAVKLPSQKNPKDKILFLDLENTLVTLCKVGEVNSHSIKFDAQKGQDIEFSIKLRPFLYEFLKTVAEYWEIYIFTSMKRDHAISIMRFLDPIQKYIKGILHKDNCMKTNQGHYIKDLRIIKKKDISQMAILDKSVISFAFQIDNGIPLIEWSGNMKDRELNFICDYMVKLSQAPDIREMNRETFRLSEITKKSIGQYQF